MNHRSFVCEPSDVFDWRLAERNKCLKEFKENAFGAVLSLQFCYFCFLQCNSLGSLIFFV
jgi:hypothetical protein